MESLYHSTNRSLREASITIKEERVKEPPEFYFGLDSVLFLVLGLSFLFCPELLSQP